METAMMAGVLIHPVALAVLVGIAYAAVVGYSGFFSPAALSKTRLVFGLTGVFLAAVIGCALAGYASPEDARRFGVPESERWSTIWRQIITMAIASSYISILGASIFGIPIALFMSRRGLATVPLYVLASVPMSLVVGCLFFLWISLDSSHIFQDAVVLTATHAWVAAGFAIGAGLPWRRSRQFKSVA